MLLKKATADSRSLALELLLVVAILYGLATKLVLSLNLRLNSDNVVPGLMARDFWEYKNYLLSDFFLPVHDTYLFTDVVPFHMIPQIISGFDPVALRLTGYVVFLLLLAAVSLLVYRVTGNLISTLILAALGANINVAGYTEFATPNNHAATAFFCAVLILLALYVNPVRSAALDRAGGQNESASGEKQKPGSAADQADGTPVDVPPVDALSVDKNKGSARRWPATAAALLLPALTFLIAYSDTIAILWFVLPYLFCYLVLYKEKTTRSDLVSLSLIVAIGAAYVLKMFSYTNVTITNEVQGVSHIFKTLPDYLSNLWYLLSPGISPVLKNSSIGLAEVIGFSLLILAIGLSIYAAVRNPERKARFLYLILLLSAGIMAGAFISSSFAGDLSTSRYLSFTAIAIFILIAMGYSGLSGRLRTAYLSLILVMLAVAVIGSYLALGTISHEPNKAEYDLIEKLESQGIDHCYGTYWTANVVSYLSDGEVLVRSVSFTPDGRIIPIYWNSCSRWYKYDPEDTYLLTDNNTMAATERYMLLTVLANVNSTDPEYYSKYTIFGVRDLRLSRIE